MSSFVYIAPLLNKNAFKIGKSENPISRIVELTRFYEFDFKEVYIIDCENCTDAYKIESLLHIVCNKKRVFFDYDGGTEFFSYEVYEKLLFVANTIVEINKLKISRMPPIEDIKVFEVVKSNDVELLLNSLTNKLKHKRLEYNITQKQLAKITGMSIRTIQRMEDSGVITLINFIRILKALDLDSILSEFQIDIPEKQRSR